MFFMIRVRVYYLLFVCFISKTVNGVAKFAANAIQLRQVLLLELNLANFNIAYTFILLGRVMRAYEWIFQAKVHWADFLPSGLIHKTR